MSTQCWRFRTVLGAGLMAAWQMTAASALAAVVVTPYAGTSGGMGQAYNPATQQLYVLEADSGEMSRVNTVTGAVFTIQTGLVHPNDLALHPGGGVAYVTTRVGELWKASTLGNFRILIANGLGNPGEIVLDPGNFVAYTVDYDSGALWRVELGSGAKTAVVTGLNSPRGLLMSADFETAIVTEANRIASVHLPTKVVTQVVGPLVNPWFMEWTDEQRNAFYLVEREPGNRLHRVDLTTSPATLTALTPLPFRPTSVVRSVNPDLLYVASRTVLSKVALSSGVGGPILTRLGFVPSTEIDASGRATTDPSYFFHVKNASFGGSIHLMLNFPGMLAAGATHYEVRVDGAVALATWTNYKWILASFKPVTVAPQGNLYEIPQPGQIWAIPDLAFVWDSTQHTNALHKIRVSLYNNANPMGVFEEVPVLVDNNPPVLDILAVKHDGVPLNECALITSGSAQIEITYKAFDAEGHLFSYALTDGWGGGQSAEVAEDHYIGVHDASPTWSGVSSQTLLPYTFSNTACAHSLHLAGWANTTNGYSRIHYVTDTEHIAIYLGGVPCAP